MRLNNYALLQRLMSMGLSVPNFNAVKLYMCLGERLKDTEQSMLYLKRCKSNRIFPLFIMNSFKFHSSIFPDKLCSLGHHLIFKLRLMCLNQNIQNKYKQIRETKQKLFSTHNQLKAGIPRMTPEINRLFAINNKEAKESSKRRLCQKFNWLIFKYYSAEHTRGVPYDSSHQYTVTHNHMDPWYTPTEEPQDDHGETVLQNADDKVTCINIDSETIPEDFKNLLALGPNFAVSPNFSGKSKERIIEEVTENIAEMAISLRWNAHLSANSSPTVPTLYQHNIKELKSSYPFDKKSRKLPPADNPDLENKMLRFKEKVVQILKKTSVKPNITNKQREALHAAKSQEDIHISVADKTAEFVIMKKDEQIAATKYHFSDTSIYKKLDMPNDEKGTAKFIHKLTETIETKANAKWNEICEKRDVPNKIRELFTSHHTVLSTGRIQVKTHKHSLNEIHNISPTELKVRPIVSGCGTPYDKISWLICHILRPLMECVPAHFKNTHSFLSKLQQAPADQLKNLTFCTADVVNLYTNIDVSAAIDNIIELAEQNIDKLTFYGLKLVDIHELLEIILTSSFFRYDSQVYEQLQGLLWAPDLHHLWSQPE